MKGIFRMGGLCLKVVLGTQLRSSSVFSEGSGNSFVHGGVYSDEYKAIHNPGGNPEIPAVSSSRTSSRFMWLSQSSNCGVS